MANTRNNAADIREGTTETLEDCVRLCMFEPLCLSSTFLQEDGKCLLKNTKERSTLLADWKATTWIKECAGTCSYSALWANIISINYIDHCIAVDGNTMLN